MDALRSISSGSSEQKQGYAISVDKENDGINSIPEEEKIILNQEIEKVEEKDDQRVNVSISGKAYDALEKFTKELNQRESGSKKPFTVEEVLDEEILLLFSDEWNKK
ncbi:MAG: hypothetical protein WAK17_09595 [Candidatus Nitrosopolaris sp.]|jgi:hypothetical protein